MMPNFHTTNRQTIPVIGLNVDIGNMSNLSRVILNISKRPMSHSYVCVANAHMLTLARQTSDFKKVLNNASLVVPDGMPLVWSQKLKGYKNAERVCGPDLMLELCKQVSLHGGSIYLLGGNSRTLSLLSEKLVNLFPGLQIAGMHAPTALPEKPTVDEELTKQINHSGANILFVGLGCPKQEYWCATHAPYLRPIAIGVGAAFDFHTGTKKRPPAFIQGLGLEWLYRLISEPRRLWKRYLTTNTAFIYYSLLDFIKHKN
ncbi:WecB/TagA/CpsF family glycosyltransferase [Polynucleobacter necessarius]|uniref:WecB/TagA/CpsF family glycosyltransferase n=1 Tax=Polynucleobacter necessarius TaxID=576610 RepID=UPI000FE1E1A4|nr:WecB/TagA/CpsF family glycosyltransferase [Polynucleobacter necessarius]